MGLLSRVLVSDAAIDLVVPERVEAGTTVAGHVDVTGGRTERAVDAVYAALRTRYDTGDGREAATVSEYTLVEEFTIDPDEDRSFDVDLPLPHATPVSGSADVWIDTGLDIDWKIDPDDTDPIDVDPGPRLRTLTEAVETLGFDRLFSEAVPAAGSPLATAAGELPLVQLFVYRSPGVGAGRDVSDVATLVHPGEDRLTARVAVDRRDRPVAEWGAEEGVEVTVADADEPPAVADRLREAIDALA